MSAAIPGADPVLCSAFHVGWLVAQLHGPILDVQAESDRPLPTIKEMGRADRVKLTVDQLAASFASDLAGPLGSAGGTLLGSLNAALAEPRVERAAIQTAVEHLHTRLLTKLTVADQRLGSSYSLGRTLSDTCWLPATKDDLCRELNRYRLTELQGWLSDLASGLPPGSAETVSEGLDHWATWVDLHSKLEEATFSSTVSRAVRAQGDQWRALLAGEKDPASLVTPEAYVAAGERALHRAGHIARRVAIHFWLLILIVFAAVGVCVVVALRYADGTAKLWGAIVPLAAGLGITGTSIKATTTRLGKGAGRPLLRLAKTDAMGWAATSLPVVDDGALQRHKLRKAGVAPPVRR